MLNTPLNSRLDIVHHERSQLSFYYFHTLSLWFQQLNHGVSSHGDWSVSFPLAETH